MKTYDDTDVEAANEARLAMELDLNQRGLAHEVVVLQASSEEALRRTHARYFEGLETLYSRLESSTSAFVIRETGD